MARTEPLFTSAAEMVEIAERRGMSLGKLALAYEATLLGLSEAEIMEEILRRYDIMVRSVNEGLDPTPFLPLSDPRKGLL